MNISEKIQEVSIGRYKLAYDIFMATLAIGIIFSLLLQSRSDITYNQLYFAKQIDFIIWIIFVSDYVIRLFYAENKMKFVKSNLIDLISILPLDVAFQGLRVARLARLFYMFRVFVYLNRLYKRLNSVLTMNNFHHVLWFTFATIFSGAIAISYIDDMEIGDALWWSFVTTTTVGYGDIAPTSMGGRIVAVFLMIIGIGFLSTLTGTISSYFINMHAVQSRYRDDALKQVIEKLENFPALSNDDIDDIHSVLIALKTKEVREK